MHLQHPITACISAVSASLNLRGMPPQDAFAAATTAPLWMALDSCFITLSLRREKQGLIVQLHFLFRGDFSWFAHNLQRIPVFPSTFTLSSHVKSFFHARLNPLTVCLTFDRRAFLVTGSVTGSDSESSPRTARFIRRFHTRRRNGGALSAAGRTENQ